MEVLRQVGCRLKVVGCRKSAISNRKPEETVNLTWAFEFPLLHSTYNLQLTLLPNRKIHRYPNQRYNQPGPGEFGFVNDEQDTKAQPHDDVNYWEDRISKCFIWAVGIGSFLSENENSGDR